MTDSYARHDWFTTWHIRIFTSAHVYIFVCSHLHIFTCLHLHNFSFSLLDIACWVRQVPHILTFHIFTFAHLHICTFPHFHIFDLASGFVIYIFTYIYMYIYIHIYMYIRNSWMMRNIFTFSHFHICTFSHFHIFTFWHLNIMRWHHVLKCATSSLTRSSKQDRTPRSDTWLIHILHDSSTRDVTHSQTWHVAFTSLTEIAQQPATQLHQREFAQPQHWPFLELPYFSTFLPRPPRASLPTVAFRLLVHELVFFLCCFVLQCVAVRRRALQCHCWLSHMFFLDTNPRFWCVEEWCWIVWCSAVCCSVLQRVEVRCSICKRNRVTYPAQPSFWRQQPRKSNCQPHQAPLTVLHHMRLWERNELLQGNACLEKQQNYIHYTLIRVCVSINVWMVCMYVDTYQVHSHFFTYTQRPNTHTYTHPLSCSKKDGAAAADVAWRHTYTHTYACIYTCIYVCTYIYMCIHIYI